MNLVIAFPGTPTARDLELRRIAPEFESMQEAEKWFAERGSHPCIAENKHYSAGRTRLLREMR